MRYFEEIEIGRSLEIGSHRVSKDEIIRFAEQWDPQPFHLDETAAKASVFEGLSASSCHTYSISSLIFARATEKRSKAAAMLEMKVRFPTAVRPDDLLTLHELCRDKRVSRSRPRYGIVESEARLLNQRGEAVMILESSFLVDRRES